MKNITFILILIIICSCSAHKDIANGAFSDISLNATSNDYKIMRLDPIQSSESAIFGIPEKKLDNNQGVIFRLNGINVKSSNRGKSILSLLGQTVIYGVALNQAFYKEQTNWSSSQNAYVTTVSNPFPIVLSTIIAFPIAGIINNNLIFPNAALGMANQQLNKNLIDNNKDIDVFLNPKYEIDLKGGLFKQNATIKANIMGAKILTD